MAFAVVPFGSPFFVTECGHQSEGEKDCLECVAVGNLGLYFDAVLMAVFAGPDLWETLVGHRPAAGVVANAENFSAGAHAAVRSVVENITLEAAWSEQRETRGLKSPGEAGEVIRAKLDLGFDGHHKERVYGNAPIPGQMAIGQHTAAAEIAECGGGRVLPRRAAGDNKNVKTLRLTVNPRNLYGSEGSTIAEADEALNCAAEIIRNGGLVALPTETVYGLGANALDAGAVARIFEAKQRPAWDPIIVHISDEAMLENLVAEVPEAGRRLMKTFWPGPITLLLQRSTVVPDAVTAGRALVGVRMPAHPVALEVIRRAGVPVAAPSANLFGHISPTTAAHVLQDLDGRIDAVLDGGSTAHGVESTVLDPGQSPMVIYRPGAVTAEEIRAVGGAVEVFRSSGALSEKAMEALPSPGAGLRHYAPKARLMLVEAPFHRLGRALDEKALSVSGERLGIMLPAEISSSVERAELFAWGRWSAPEELARNLYAGLRELDAQGCTVILCPLPAAEGIGVAIRDRLRKAAAGK